MCVCEIMGEDGGERGERKPKIVEVRGPLMGTGSPLLCVIQGINTGHQA